QPVLFHALLEDLEDQVLFLEPREVGDILGFRRADELGHRHLLKLGQVDLPALDVFIAVVERGVAENVFFIVGEGDGQIPITGCRRTFRTYWRLIITLAVAIPFSGAVLRFTIRSIPVTSAGVWITRSVPRQRRGITLTIAISITSDGNPLVVDWSAAVALAAIACQSLPHREHRLPLRPLADRLAITLPDEPDRLAVRRSLFLERL